MAFILDSEVSTLWLASCTSIAINASWGPDRLGWFFQKPEPHASEHIEDTTMESSKSIKLRMDNHMTTKAVISQAAHMSRVPNSKSTIARLNKHTHATYEKSLHCYNGCGINYDEKP